MVVRSRTEGGPTEIPGRAGMILYEVNVRVLDEIVAEYRDWLETHIEELLRVEGILAAEWYMVDTDVEAEKIEREVRKAIRLDESVAPALREAVMNPIHTTPFTVHYRMQDQETYDRYLKDHAPRLRQDGIDRFGAKFAATRRVLRLHKTFVAENP